MKRVRLQKESPCKKCPLYKSPGYLCMPPMGEKNPDVYILGEAPGAEEQRQGYQFVGPAGKLLRNALRGSQEGLPTATLAWDNCVRCYLNRPPKKEEVLACSEYVKKSIEKYKPKIILGTGNVPLNMITGEDKITKWRGSRIPVKIGKHKCWYYPILHPSFILRNQRHAIMSVPFFDYEEVFLDDLRRVFTDLQDLDTPHIISKRESKDGIKIIRRGESLDPLRKLIETSSAVALDIETTGLRPYKNNTKIISYAFSNGQDTVAVTNTNETLLFLQGLFDYPPDIPIICHNLAFELEWLAYFLGKDKIRNFFWEDTMVQSYVLDSNKARSLNAICLRTFGLNLKSITKVDARKIQSYCEEDILIYNGLDAKYTYYIWLNQSIKIRDEELEETYCDHIRRIPTVVSMQHEGIRISRKRAIEASNKIQEEIDKKRKEIQSLPEVINFVRRNDEFNPASPKQVKELLHCEGYLVESTNEENLNKLKTKFARLILELRKAVKLNSTYVKPFAEENPDLVYPDGKIHTQFNTALTATGRLSSEKPNMQNFPKRENLYVRRMIIPPNGHFIISFDYKQIEVCVICMFSKDKNLIKALKEKRDIHSEWAEYLNKLYPRIMRHKEVKGEFSKLRFLTKNSMVFASFYGSTPASIAKIAKIPDDIVTKWQKDFWKEFAGVKRWQWELKDSYGRKGYVECLNGRRRYAPLNANMVINTPIQGTASDIVVDAMNRLSEIAEEKNDPPLQPILNIHDDLTFYIPIHKKRGYINKIIREMLRSSYSWVNVPLAIEVSIGKNWEEMKEVDVYYGE